MILYYVIFSIVYYMIDRTQRVDALLRQAALAPPSIVIA